MSASKDSHKTDRPLWLSLLGHFLGLVCVGVIVKLLVMLATHMGVMSRESPHRIDLSAWDALMRDWAKSDLRDLSRDAVLRETFSADPWNRLVFIDVDDETCRKWGKTEAWKPMGCTMSSLTPRTKLAEVIEQISEAAKIRQNKPALVVLDIDLAASAGASTNEGDSKLCGRVVQLAAQVPVIVVRPTVLSLTSAVKDDRVVGYTSIFDAAFSLEPSNDCLAESKASTIAADWKRGQSNLWFGSPVVLTDQDGVIRRVGRGQQFSILEEAAGPKGDTVLGSIGLLGAALLDDIDAAELACYFPGSKRRAGQSTPRCGRPGGQLERLLSAGAEEGSETGPERPDALDPPKAPVRIRFSVPSLEMDRNGRTYEGAASLLCHMPAYQLPPLLGNPPGSAGQPGCGRTNALANAVVMIGGSYLASGDLRATPLNVRVPGAVVHLNAIRAFAQALRTDKLAPWVFTPRDGLLDWILIVVAAALGTGLYVVTRWVSRGRTESGTALIRLAMSLGGTIVEVVVILIITMSYGASQLFAGNGVEILTPPLSIALEGLSTTYYLLHELVTDRVAMALQRAREFLSADLPEQDVCSTGTSGAQIEDNQPLGE